MDIVLGAHIDPTSPPEAWEEVGLPEVQKTLGADIPMMSDVGVNELVGLSYDDLRNKLLDAIKLAYEVREHHVGTETMRELERMVLLRTIDGKWVDYLHNIDILREGIHLRSYGQRDPLQEYKREAFDMFNQLLRSIQEESIQLIFKAQMVNPDDIDDANGSEDGPGGPGFPSPTPILPDESLLRLIGASETGEPQDFNDAIADKASQ
jgi:preprotein translocase subunit SecA